MASEEGKASQEYCYCKLPTRDHSMLQCQHCKKHFHLGMCITLIPLWYSYLSVQLLKSIEVHACLITFYIIRLHIIIRICVSPLILWQLKFTRKSQFLTFSLLSEIWLRHITHRKLKRLTSLPLHEPKVEFILASAWLVCMAYQLQEVDPNW